MAAGIRGWENECVCGHLIIWLGLMTPHGDLDWVSKVALEAIEFLGGHQVGDLHAHLVPRAVRCSKCNSLVQVPETYEISEGMPILLHEFSQFFDKFLNVTDRAFIAASKKEQESTQAEQGGFIIPNLTDD